jgi:hypothetical protein
MGLRLAALCEAAGRALAVKRIDTAATTGGALALDAQPLAP